MLFSGLHMFALFIVVILFIVSPCGELSFSLMQTLQLFSIQLACNVITHVLRMTECCKLMIYNFRLFIGKYQISAIDLIHSLILHFIFWKKSINSLLLKSGRSIAQGVFVSSRISGATFKED